MGKMTNAGFRQYRILSLLFALICISCTEPYDCNTYEGQLASLRNQYKSFNMNAPRFFLFGMGNRDKFIYHDYQLIALDNDSVVFRAEEAIEDSIMPADYCISIKTERGIVRIEEDKQGIWISQSNQRYQVSNKNCEINLPSFEEFRYGKVLRVLHHELLFNIRNSRIYPNIFVYQAPFYRDAFMAALCLEKTGNTHLIQSWLSEEENVYDMQNREVEADNLGEMLYLLSFIPSDSNKAFRDTLLAEIEKQTIHQGDNCFIKGHTDGAENAEYQTQILKFACQKNKLDNTYTNVPEEDTGDYFDLCWFTQGSDHSRSVNRWYKDMRFNYKDSPFPYLQWARAHYYNNTNAAFNGQQYPLSWEKRGGSAHFEGMHIISDKAVEERICYPHAWTAAEMFLKLYVER